MGEGSVVSRNRNEVHVLEFSRPEARDCVRLYAIRFQGFEPGSWGIQGTPGEARPPPARVLPGLTKQEILNKAE